MVCALSRRQADNIISEADLCLLAEWPEATKQAKLTNVVWPDARELLEKLLCAAPAERPGSWAEVLDSRFLSASGCPNIPGGARVCFGGGRGVLEFSSFNTEKQIRLHAFCSNTCI